ncbi:hypothetical protein N9099_00410 [Mariniblastus sp.]|nr:hypothetical protein [Mariniblastus sp.]
MQTVIVARLFGTTRQIEVFMAASSLNAMALRLFQSGQIYEIFLPTYISVKNSQGIIAANQLSSVLLSWIMICFTTLLCILFLAAPFIVDMVIAGFSEFDKAEATLMFRVLLPLIGVQLFSGIFLMLGNAEKQFSKFQLPSLFSLSFSILILFFVQDSIGAWVMVLALWVSQLTLLIFRLALLRKIEFRYSFSLQNQNLSIKTFFLKIVTTVPSTIAMTFFETIFTRELSQLRQGELAIVNYARQILTKIRGLMIRPTSIVFFTSISETDLNTKLKTKKLVSKALGQILNFIMIASITSWYVLPYLLFSLYHNENFSLEKVRQLSTLISFLQLALLFDGLGVIYQKYNVSAGRITSQYINLALARIAATLLATALIPLYGFAGVVAVLVIQPLLYSLASTLALDKIRQGVLAWYSIKSISKWIAIWAIIWLFGSSLNSISILELTPETSQLQSTIIAITSCVILLITSLGLGLIFKIHGVSDLLFSITRPRKKGKRVVA